jgi:phenylacetic acid degradation operon negative regulatory protein
LSAVNQMPNDSRRQPARRPGRTATVAAENEDAVPRVARSKPAISKPELPEPSWLRPQSVVFTLLAEHLLDKDLALFSGSFIAVLGRLGIGEHAVRSTLARMTRRGLLERRRRGREIYFRMTPRCVAILEDGRTRIWQQGAINTDTAAPWTALTFSLPEAWRKQRYDLTARLTWAGFGPLQNGVWLAPAQIDVTGILGELGLHNFVRVFALSPRPPTDPAALIGEIFDLEALAERYRAFSAAWQPLARTQAADALVLTLRLSTQWLQIIRSDPRVPLHLLPAGWPAIEAQRLFRSLHGAHRERAEAIASEVLVTIEG